MSQFPVNSNTLFLLPGEMIVTREICRISTVLGSCVAVCIYDPMAKISGMNHYLLPEVLNRDKPSPRYGDFALPELLRAVLAQGGQLHRLEAQIFGGGNVIANNQIGEIIGRKNVELAEQFLLAENIKVVRWDLNGDKGRKIIFDTSTFEATVSYNEDD